MAKFQFECDYRVPSGPFYQPVNSRTESHQNKPNKGKKSHFCLWLSEKDPQRRHLKGQALLPSHDLAELKRYVFSTGFIAAFFLQQRLCTENFVKQTSRWRLFNRERLGHFFLKSNKSIMKWTSWNTFHSYEEMRSVTNDSASIIIYKACLEGKKYYLLLKKKGLFNWFCLCFSWVYNWNSLNR